MEVARVFEEISVSGPVLLTIGTFDGVHRGHRYLLEQARQRASEHQYGLVIVTFDPCPAVVLRPSLGRYQLTSAAQKLELLAAVEPAAVILLHFTPELSQLTAGEFMDALEARLDIRELWFGEDFRFGRDRGGDLQMLVTRGRESGFSLHVVSRRMEERESISSSRIRKALGAGDVEGVIPLLGYPFSRACSSDLRTLRRTQLMTMRGAATSPHIWLYRQMPSMRHMPQYPIQPFPWSSRCKAVMPLPNCAFRRSIKPTGKSQTLNSSRDCVPPRNMGSNQNTGIRSPIRFS